MILSHLEEHHSDCLARGGAFSIEARVVRGDRRLLTTFPLVGRETQVERICAFLNKAVSQQKARILQVGGPAGIGKTSVCLSALSRFLEKSSSPVYHIILPRPLSTSDGGQSATEQARAHIGRVMGAPDRTSAHDIAVQMRRYQGIYYLDGAEALMCDAEVDFFRQVLEKSEIKLLVSSTRTLESDEFQRFSIPPLDDEASAKLFEYCWLTRGGTSALPEPEMLARFAGGAFPEAGDISDRPAGRGTRFVGQSPNPIRRWSLGGHPLTIVLVACRGDEKSFHGLERDWMKLGLATAVRHTEQGVPNATSAAANTTDFSVDEAITLSAQWIPEADKAQALHLWILCALFPAGLQDGTWEYLRDHGHVSEAARHILIRRGVLVLCNDRLIALKPIARYALERAIRQEADFSLGGPLHAMYDYLSSLGSATSHPATDDRTIGFQQYGVHPILDEVTRRQSNEYDALASFMEISIDNVRSASSLLDLAVLNDLWCNTHQYRTHQAIRLLKALEARISQELDVVPDSVRRSRGAAAKQPEQEGLEAARSEIQMHLAGILSRMGLHLQARDLFERSLSFWCALGRRRPSRRGSARATNDSMEVRTITIATAHAAWGLGDAHRCMGNIREAREYLGQALIHYEQLGLLSEQGGVLRSLGDLEREQGNIEVALIIYGTALETLGCFYTPGRIVLKASGRLLPLALGSGRIAEETWLRDDDFTADLPLGSANIFVGIGMCRLEQREMTNALGALEEAWDLFAIAFAVFERFNDRVGKANARLGLGCAALGQCDGNGENSTTRDMFYRSGLRHLKIAEEFYRMEEHFEGAQRAARERAMALQRSRVQPLDAP